MKRFLLLSVASLLLACGTSFAARTDCSAGTFASVMGSYCYIGDKTFYFDGSSYSGEFYDSTTGATVEIDPNNLYFNPIVSGDADGFSIYLLPGTASLLGYANSQEAFVVDNFSVTTGTGQEITGNSATISESEQIDDGYSDQQSQALLYSTAAGQSQDFYGNSYGTPSHSQTAQTGLSLTTEYAFFSIYNYSNNPGYPAAGTGSSSFTSATFLFQQSPTSTPEPGGLALLATGLLGVAGVVRRRISK